VIIKQLSIAGAEAHIRTQTQWKAIGLLVQLGPGRFGIFDTFANEVGRNALSVDIVKELNARASELFAVPPQVGARRSLQAHP
jgi:hypothetical protein